MYLKEIKIKNIRSLREFHWVLDDKECAGWHVLIGDNGAGKSTFLRALALAFAGPKNAYALRQDWNDWLTRGENHAQVSLQLIRDNELDVVTKSGVVGKKLDYKAFIELKRDETNPSFVELIGHSKSSNPETERHVWGSGKGWFVAAYGPFRRFTGGNSETERLFLTNPRLGALLSIFGEDVALTETIRWLKELQYKLLEGSDEPIFLKQLMQFINQDGFLPHKTQLKVIGTSGIYFEDANGKLVTIEEMSDGYRSILSMTFEIIRQLQAFYKADEIFSEDATKVLVSGVVMIDEIDAHLHPSWQKRIGLWFRTHFPAMQFIVTSHSPLICQASEVGTVWRLPKPGTDEKVLRVLGDELNRLLYGDIEEAYSTALFGLTSTRSEASQEMLEELAALNTQELFGRLSAKEKERQEALQKQLPIQSSVLNEVEE